MNDHQQPPSTNPLDNVQRWFQAVVTHPNGVTAGAASTEALALRPSGAAEIEQTITRSRALTAVERLSIYANAYYARLLECLGEVFPVCKKTLGDEVFNGFAFGYLQQHPSRSYTLTELGRHFPDYLSETRPEDEPVETAEDASELGANWPEFLIDLARLEWTIYQVFDGPGVEGKTLLQPDQLLDISPAAWPSAKLDPVPCLRILPSRFPVNDYYTSARKAGEADAVTIPEEKESFTVITRRDFIVRRYNLSRMEFTLLKALCEGETIGAAIERTVEDCDSDLDALAVGLNDWFRHWTSEGFFQGVLLPSPPPEKNREK